MSPKSPRASGERYRSCFSVAGWVSQPRVLKALSSVSCVLSQSSACARQMAAFADAQKSGLHAAHAANGIPEPVEPKDTAPAGEARGHQRVDTATAIINSHLIRTARMLGQMARVLGVHKDLAVYEEDIALWSEALQKHSWDPEAGYFSYVLHDDQGQANGILRHESGKNFNLGQDGVMPLLADICTPEQEQTLLGHLQSPERLWSPIGLSTVDQSAPYYRHDGYWNGAVWMPHQWFLWKAMLDLGQADFAFKIAQTALDLWKSEVDESYECFEHFLIESGRGAGWHQFSSLSSPVLAWFSAYYRPGRLTTGFDTWVHRCTFGPRNSAVTAELELRARPGKESTVLVTLRSGRDYVARWNGQPVPARPAASGTLQIKLPRDGVRGRLEIA